MSIIHGDLWSTDDIKSIFKCLDEKTGMHASEVDIIPYDILTEDLFAFYTPDAICRKRHFSISLFDFDKSNVSDYKIIEKLRRAYCAYVEDELSSFFEKNGFKFKIVHKSICGMLNIRETELTEKDMHRMCYSSDRFYYWWNNKPKASVFSNISHSRDVRKADIKKHILSFGADIPCIAEKRELEKKLLNRFSKAKVFYIGEQLSHKKNGFGYVIDTFPMDNKQMLLVRFNDGTERVVQNRDSYKIVNGIVKKPKSKFPSPGYTADEINGK